MKRNIFKILIFIFLLLGFANTYDVYAEETPLSSLPKTYKTSDTDGYEFNIKGFYLRVYEVNTTDDSTGINRFLHNNPNSTIELTSDELSIKPEYNVQEINGVSSTIVNLNLNLTKARLESFLTNEKSRTTNDTAFIIEIVLNYELKTPKVNTTYMYNFNAVKYANTRNEDGFSMETVTLNSDVYQTLNIGLLYYDNRTNSVKLDYETSWDEDSIGLAGYVLNYLMLSNETFSDTNRTAEDLLLFHNVDDINYIISLASNGSTSEIDPSNDPIGDIIKKGQTVAVPNTAATIPNFVYIISLIMIILGSGVITYTVVKE